MLDLGQTKREVRVGLSFLGVLFQFRVLSRRRNKYHPQPLHGHFHRVVESSAALGESLDKKRGVRRTATALQLGLTSSEIEGVQARLRSLLKDIDRGKIKTF